MLAKSQVLQRASLLLVATTLGCSVLPPNPALFDSGLENHLGLTFSPDGETAYWASWNGKWGSGGVLQRQIYVSTKRDDRWSRATPLVVLGESNNDDPFVSPDGRWLYFISDARTSPDDNVRDTNIWRYRLRDAGTLEPVPVNSTASEYSPVVTSSGAIYFASDRAGGAGAGDIYRAMPSAGGFHSPKPLGPGINSEHGEWNVWVSSDEGEMLFEASSRPTNVTVPGDIYYSWRTDSGWAAAIPVAQLNTTNSDLMPRLHPDGKTLYYTSAPIGGQAEIKVANWPQLRKQLRYSQ